MTPEHFAELYEKARYESMLSRRWEELRPTERQARTELALAALEASGLAETLRTALETAERSRIVEGLLAQRDAELARRGAEHREREEALVAELAAARAEHHAEVEAVRAEHRAEVAQLSEQHDTDRARLESQRDAEVACLLSQHQAELDSLRADHQAELGRVRADHTADVARLEAEHAAEVRWFRTAHEAELDRLRGDLAARADGAEPRDAVVEPRGGSEPADSLPVT
ncbi:hypothetical protein N867_05895 [Actinotalea fermentans ATCC 43279 = JCM 9966 = DSM 3133]|nr:hypothetical protein N867_05895 [Actinotalea fermentans ATCC 43279 = JCM 9966 = DSM 3133]